MSREVHEESAAAQEGERITPRPRPFSRSFDGEDKWEWWARIGVAMLVLQVVAWAVVFMRLGTVSVYAHGVAISALGGLTLPVVLWGLIRSMFNPPVLRRSRTIGFTALLAVGLMGNVPIIAPPLSTEGWQASQPYHLPFDGEWSTLAGGDSRATNYHATTATYRWGYDFTIVRDGQPFAGRGAQLEDYFCFGEPILAPVAGQVVTMVDDVADNKPGEYDGNSILGNYIVIEVGQEEYLYVAHLRQESIPVKVTQRISAGDKIGECGNSGRTLAPHVHVHLQNSTRFPFAESLPLRFSNYVADGQPVKVGMPVGQTEPEAFDGQLVRNANQR